MNKTLLIMAAGMGSRFGGLKQIEPIGPNGEFLIDYSIYDAIKAGFTKVVFIIKEENYDVFKETIGARIDDKIPVEYVFQKLTDLPEGISLPEGREKPWGTGHAIMSAKNNINEPFAVINADDFYGRDSYMILADHLDNNPNSWVNIGYMATNTLSEYGPAKRGVCNQDGDNLISITESSVERKDGIITASPLNGSEPYTINDDTLVSMNMFGFTPDLFQILDRDFVKFLKNNKDPLKGEFLIPDIVARCVENKEKEVKLKKTTAKWLGMTYKEDKDMVIKEIKKLVDNGEYPNNLWD